jgi:hypothetical protein
MVRLVFLTATLVLWVLFLLLVSFSFFFYQRRSNFSLGDTADYSSVLEEAEDVELKRESCKKDLEALHQARKILQQTEFSEFSE